MKQLVYFIAFGEGCIDQASLCIESISHYSQVDVLLVTDQDVESNGVKVIHAQPPVPPANGDIDPIKAQYHAYFTYRTNIHKLTDLSKWDRVWYMDTDFILTGDLFGRYADAEFTYLCREPGTYIKDIHFSGALTQKEINVNPFQRGINAGLYSVPRKHYGFFAHYHSEVIAMLSRVERAWLCEQHILNMMFVRFARQYGIRTFDSNDIGFPAKQVPGTMALHYACYKFEDKLKLMQDEATRRIARN